MELTGREVLRTYADGQNHLYTGRDQQRGEPRPLGFSTERHAAALALCDLGDDEPATTRADAQR